MGILSSKLRGGYLALALVVLIAGGLSLSGILPALRCPLNAFFGVSCPMCGTTRAWCSFFAGNYREAFIFNPLFLLWGGACFLAFLDLLHKGFGGTAPTVGEDVMHRLAASPLVSAALSTCFVGVLIYNNHNFLESALGYFLQWKS